jgi:hypothetical protein
MSRSTAFQVKPLYSVRELAEALGWPAHRVRRLLVRCEVKVPPAGRSLVIPRPELEKVGWLWEALVSGESFDL